MSLKKIGFGISVSVTNSGLTIITKKLPGNLVYSALVSRAGSVFDPPGQSGLAHLIEHCLFDGTISEAIDDKFPLTSDTRINQIVESKGGTLNGQNSYLSTAYVLDFNKCYAKVMLELLLRLVLLPKLSSPSIAYQKNVICAEIARREQNPDFGAGDDFTHFGECLRTYLFERNPIRNSAAGKKGEIVTIKPSMVRSTFREFYAPNTLALIVVGPLNQNFVLGLVQKFEERFTGFLPQKVDRIPRFNPEFLKEKKLRRQIVIMESKDPRQDPKHLVVGMGYRAPAASRRDCTPIRILDAVMGGLSSGRLYRHFREKLGLSYYADSRYFRTPVHGEFVCAANFYLKEGWNSRSVIDMMQGFVSGQLRAIQSGEISRDEFERAKEALYQDDRKFGVDDAEYVRNFLISAFETRNLTSGESTAASVERELGTSLKVRGCSFERFIAAVKRQIDPERYVLLVNGPPGCYPC